jgi:hypothetical protein
MKFSGRFKSRLEANVGIGGCVFPQPDIRLLKTQRSRGPFFADRIWALNFVCGGVS